MTGRGGKTSYILMNKDVPMLEFHCQRNEFDEPEFFEDQWLITSRPIGYHDLVAFLKQRRSPKHRKHIKQLLEQYGCDDLDVFLHTTHALSLNDTFWVREADSPLTWKDVSLYTGPFNEIVSESAFDGLVREKEPSPTSPEFGTDGRYAKCWKHEAGNILLYKRGSTHYGLEPLSEYLAAQLSNRLCSGAVPYDIGYYHGNLISKCPLFTNETVGLVKASAVFYEEKITIPKLLTFFDGIGSGDAFRRMCILDAIILNADRHFGNFGVLFDTETLEIIGMAPAFDHNRSLLPELNNNQIVDSVCYLRHCKPKLGQDFILNARRLLTDSIRQDLIELEDFKFQQHNEILVKQARLDALSKIVQERIRLILSDSFHRSSFH